MGIDSIKGNMYEWISKTKNPIAGVCEYSCRYCFVESLKKRFPVIRNKYTGEIRLDEKVLSQKLGSGKFYFIQSMGDLFAENVPDHIIVEVLKWLNKYPDNTYLLQSKNPARIIDFVDQLPKDVFIGTTIETNRTQYHESKAPSYMERAKALGELRSLGFDTMVTIEPIFDFDLDELVEIIMTANPKWINIGADSKGHNLPEPSKDKVKKLIETLQSKTDVELKRNLDRILEGIPS